MQSLVAEDTVTSIHSRMPYACFEDATMRDRIARKQHPHFFDTDAHVDRIVQASQILKSFFKSNPNYITARGINRSRPFTAVKYADVGRKLSKTPIAVKNSTLYQPLLNMQNVKVVSKNGHLIVQIF